MNFSYELLGQSGVFLSFDNFRVLVDPYLSDYVKHLEGPTRARLQPINPDPSTVVNVDLICVTHEHCDHCDIWTLGKIAKASPKAKFLCPAVCEPILLEAGIERERILLAQQQPLVIEAVGLEISWLPAAHPTIEYDSNGFLKMLGYVFSSDSVSVYHAGDTSVCDELISALREVGPIDLAFLPVNEDNYFRRRDNIIGNMSIRDAFMLADELNIKSVVPVHWDMFEVNGAYWEEIELIYSKRNFGFELRRH